MKLKNSDLCINIYLQFFIANRLFAKLDQIDFKL